MNTLKIAVLLVVASMLPAKGSDSFPPLPPLEEKFHSPKKVITFVVGPLHRQDKDWTESTSKGELFEKDGKRIYVRSLPNFVRPKFVMVADDGQAITFDDWQNQKTVRAILVYNREGQIIRHYSTDDVIKATGASQQELTSKAKPRLGWWMAGRPEHGKNGWATVKVGGGKLWISFLNGDLQFFKRR